MTDEELREHFADVVSELRELRRLVERPSPEHHAARLFLALSQHLDSDDAFFDREQPFDWAREDAELSAALEGLGLHEPAALGYWLRTKKARDIAGYRVVRDGRGWRMEPASR